jgi:ParB-like chromosome segregation protein Spo0J
MDDVTFLELLTIENKQRDDVTPLDEAAGFKMLMEKAGYDVAKLAARIGLSTKYVYDRLKLLQLVPAAKKLLEEGTITAGHAILLARLSPADQKRTIGDEDQISDAWRGASGGLFESEDAEGFGLDDSVKPRSVRELETWIHNNVRATPERVDPFLFPASAAAHETAKAEKLDVIHITREYRVGDDARDEKIRTFGSQAWKRADGKPEEDAYTGRSVKSKPCEFSRYGFVVAGPGQGEVFKVCVNKKKCAAHWPDQVKAEKERAKREKTRKKSGASGHVDADATAGQKERNAAAEAREEFERKALEETWTRVLAERKGDFIAGAKRRAQQLAKVPNDIIGALIDDNTELYLNRFTEYADQVERLVWPALPGKWSKGYTWRPRDAAAGRGELGLQFFLALDTGKAFDAELDRAVETAMKATMKDYDAKIAAAAKEKAENADLLGHALGKLNAERRAAKKPATKKASSKKAGKAKR